MFKKVRARIQRSSKHSQGKGTGSQPRSSIFRKASSTKEGENVPTVEPALTFSLSQDEADAASDVDHLLLTQSPKVQKISSYIFTEQELMQNELNHMRQLASKQEEIAKLQKVHEELSQRLASKEEELEQTKEELAFKEKELAETYQELSNTDSELVETKMELVDTKDKLNHVSACLMNLQHQVYDKTTRFWPWQIGAGVSEQRVSI